MNLNQYPNYTLPNKEKDEEYHKQCALSLKPDCLDGSYSSELTEMQENYDFFDGTQSTPEYNFLQETETGDTLPAVWMNAQSLRNKVKQLMGEVARRGVIYDVVGINKDLSSKKLEKKLRALADRDVMPDIEQIQEIYGEQLTDLSPEAAMPEADIEAKYEGYRDLSERIIKAALNFNLKKNRFEYTKIEISRDIWITGRGISSERVVNGFPVIERVDPRRFFFQRSSNGDFIDDSTAMGEWDVLPISDVAQEYDLTKEEIDKIKNNRKGFQGNSIPNFSISGQYTNTAFDWIQGGDKDMKVLVFKPVWKDVKYMRRKVSEDKYGNTHYKKVGDKARGKDIKEVPISVWRKCTLIGGCIIRDWGVVENRITNIDDISETLPPYTVYVPDYVNGRAVSVLSEVKPLQIQKNMYLYLMQLAVARSGTKGFFYDVSMTPDNMETEDVISYLKTTGIAFYNSVRDGYPRDGYPLKEFDLTISNSLYQLLNIIGYLDNEINKITGISEARMGQVQAASQSVGVTQASIAQSSLNTLAIFKGLEHFYERIFTKVANLIKMTFNDHKEIYSMVIGDMGIDFLKEDSDLDLHSYGVFLEFNPESFMDEAILRDMINQAMATSQISLYDGLELLLEKDKSTKIGRLKQELKNKEQELQQIQAQAAQQAQDSRNQAMLAQTQMNNQARIQEEELKTKRQIEVDNARARNNVKEKLADAEIKERTGQ